MQLSPHFTLAMLTRSMVATRRGIPNDPPPEVVERLRALAQNVLEPIRVRFGGVIINSGYRSPKLNRIIGGSPRSQHIRGEAADIEVPGQTNLALAQWIATNLDFDQVILEGYTPGVPSSGWVHVSWRARGRRHEVLTKKPGAQTYLKGLVA